MTLDELKVGDRILYNSRPKEKPYIADSDIYEIADKFIKTDIGWFNVNEIEILAKLPPKNYKINHRHVEDD